MVLVALLVILVLLFVILPLIGLALWAFITTVVVGLVIGGVARLVVPGQQPIGLLATVVCGLCGSILGGFFGQHVFHVGHFPTVLLEIAVAVGAVLLASRMDGRRLTRH